MNSKVRSIFNDKDVIENVSDLDNKYVVVLADKDFNNIFFVCAKYTILTTWLGNLALTITRAIILIYQHNFLKRRFQS